MTLVIGWWAIPALITLAVIAFGFWPDRRHYSTFGGDIVGAFQLMAGVIVALIAWLVWALLS